MNNAKYVEMLCQHKSRLVVNVLQNNEHVNYWEITGKQGCDP